MPGIMVLHKILETHVCLCVSELPITKGRFKSLPVKHVFHCALPLWLGFVSFTDRKVANLSKF